MANVKEPNGHDDYVNRTSVSTSALQYKDLQRRLRPDAFLFLPQSVRETLSMSSQRMIFQLLALMERPIHGKEYFRPDEKTQPKHVELRYLRIAFGQQRESVLQLRSNEFIEVNAATIQMDGYPGVNNKETLVQYLANKFMNLEQFRVELEYTADGETHFINFNKFGFGFERQVGDRRETMEQKDVVLFWD